jgi:Zn-dependent protease with chaperone function
LTQTVARETFYEAQGRHRRADWRLGLLSALATALLGIPLSVVVSPFLTAAAIIGLDAARVVTRAPSLFGIIAPEVRAVTDVLTGDAPRTAVAIDQGTVLMLAGGMLVPGCVVIMLAWLVVRRIFARSGPQAVAIAARMPAPRVLLLDTDMANAAVVGRSVDDATVLVPRGLLDDLGRAPTEAVVANLLATIANGDLSVAMRLAATTQTFDLVSTVLSAPINRRTRRVLCSSPSSSRR